MSVNGEGNNPAHIPAVNNLVLHDALQQRENMMANGNVPFQSNQRSEGGRESDVRGNTRRLRVEDALYYLDQVKQQFVDAPDVYIDFLDVMKDFKSQAIDTPGVIKRVSRLFRGQPNLIIAFNTFLPPGFDVSVDGLRVIITEPSGRKQIIDESLLEQSGPGSSQELQSSQVSALAPPLPSSMQSFAVPASAEVIAAQLIAPVERIVTEQPENEAPTSLGLHSNDSGPDAIISSGIDMVKYQESTLYRNKVKARFENRPEIYEQFLIILRQLHRQRHELEVAQSYKQTMQALEVLFKNEPDLMHEFKQHYRLNIPGNGISSPSSIRPEASVDSTTKARFQKSCDRTALVVSPHPVCVPKLQNPSIAGFKKRPSSMHQSGSAKRAKLANVNVLMYDTDVEEAAKFGTIEDYLFFDKVRKSLIDDGVHDNFLRCLALYNHSIISKNELIELLTPFIGRSTKLMKHVKELLGLPEVHSDSQQGDEKQRRHQVYESDMEQEHRIDFATCRRLGVSYRSLPESYEKPLCSGRTPLCDSVLNDSWVSFPCWSSEESSVAHSKKTQFEEFVFRTEDERYELDIIIEVNKSALEVLEAVQRKMSRMKKEELDSFRLGPALGGSSPSIMFRAVRRIYGDHTQEMLNGTMRKPQLMVPRLIARMRQKDFEWRKNQEICNRIWREETEKHYAKSLDHQSLIFKQNDLKMLRAKTIVSQFENLYDERADRNEEGEAMEYGPHCIYRYPEDMSVLYDVNDLVIHYVKRQANIQKEEKGLAKRYLKRFIPELFNVPPQDLSDEEGIDDQDFLEKSEGPEGDPSSGEENQKLTSVEGHPEQGNRSMQKDIDIRLSQEDALNRSCTYRLFYGANTWCIFIRLHHLMCDRLAYLKKKYHQIVEDHAVEERIRSERETLIKQCTGKTESLKSVDLDMKLGIRLLKPRHESPANYYSSLINEIKNLLDGIIDSVAFEDNVRRMFGTAAYLTFTMDKIIITIARQLQNMSNEDANAASVELYKKYRFEHPINLYSREKNEENIDDAYERAAQELFANQNCFKTFFLHDSRKVTMELIDSDVTEEGEKGDNDQEWSRYVHHYIRSLADEPSSSTMNPEDHQQLLEFISERPPLFLMKNIRAGIEKYGNKKAIETSRKEEDVNGEPKLVDDKLLDVVVTEDLHLYFSPAGNYKIRFSKGSMDLLLRSGAPRRGLDKHKAVTLRRRDRFLAWLEERLCETGDVLGPRNWLADGSRIVPVRHLDFPYITYNRYLCSVSNTSSTSSNRS